LGIFIDIYANGKGRAKYSFPYIVGMIGDGKTKYDHDGDGKTTQIGDCSASYIRNSPNGAQKIRVTYSDTQSLLEVFYFLL
jgi:mannose-binding lectin 2